MKDNKEPIHLCPLCNCVEMQFVERIERKKYAPRLRRFKCPVCNHIEMYSCSGPDDLNRQRDRQETIKIQKDMEYAKRKNLFGRETNPDY